MSNITEFFKFRRKEKPTDGHPPAPKETGADLMNIIAIPFHEGDESAGITSSQLASILTSAAEGETQQQANLIEMMCEKDPLLGGLFETRKEAASSSNWHLFEQEDGQFTDEPSPEVQEFESYLRDIGLQFAIEHLLDFVRIGYAGMVIDWGPGGIIRGFKPISHDAWVFDKGGNPAIAADEGDIPLSQYHPYQFAFVKNGHPDCNPSTVGLGRKVAWMWYFKHRTMPQWARYNEKYGQPFIVVRMSESDYNDKSKRDEILRRARKCAVDGVFATKGSIDDTGVNILSAQDNKVHERLSQFVDRSNTIRILGQLGSSEGEPGRLGNANEQAKVRNDKTERDCRLLMAYIQKQIIGPAWVYQKGENTPPPNFFMDYADPKDIKYLAEVFTTMDMRNWRPADREVQMKTGIGFKTYTPIEPNSGTGGTAGPGSKKESTPLVTREKKVEDKNKQ